MKKSKVSVLILCALILALCLSACSALPVAAASVTALLPADAQKPCPPRWTRTISST